MIDCPYCLTPQSFHRGDNCENEDCKKKVPRQYIDIARTQSPIWIVTYGAPQHGKSTLLGSLTFIVERLSLIVPGAFHTYLDDFTIKRIAAIQSGQHIGRSNLGATVKHEKPEPLIISLKNFPTRGESRVFVIFDLAGEIVDEIANTVMDDSSETPLYARAVAKARTVWFIVSLYDLQDEMPKTGKSINNLFWAYQQTMGQLNIPLEDRNILVIYTKADMLRVMDSVNQLTMPDPVQDYFERDPYYDFGNRDAARPSRLTDTVDYKDYETSLRIVSNDLKEFTEYDVPGGSAFVAMAEDSNVKLYFTIDSAQGSPSGTGTALGVQITRHRVIDPLLWTIMLSDDDGEAAVAALILPTDTNGLIYSAEFPTVTHDILRAHNLHPSTYFMGQTKAAFPTGTAPVNVVPPSTHNLLVGTILDQLSDDSVAIILTDDVLPLDVDDFADTSWDDRILLIGSDKTVLNARVQWKYQAQSPNEIAQIVREFAHRTGVPRNRS